MPDPEAPFFSEGHDIEGRPSGATHLEYWSGFIFVELAKPVIMEGRDADCSKEELDSQINACSLLSIEMAKTHLANLQAEQQ